MAKKGQVSVIFDKSKKADMIISANGLVTFTKDTVIRFDGDPEKPCRGAKSVLSRIELGSSAD